MLPGFSASSSLYQSKQMYRGGSPSAGDTLLATGIIGLAGEPAAQPIIPAATPPCVGPNCPGGWSSIAGCGESCIQGWIELLSNCTYNCKNQYSGSGGESGPNEYWCDLQCQSQFGPANWKCDCPPGSTCVNGNCGCPCTYPYSCCNNACTNTTTDVNNCGKCGQPCGAGQTCQNGNCACPSGQVLCDGSCCAVGLICRNGACSCATGQVLCNGICCQPGQICQDGKCVVSRPIPISCEPGINCVDKCLAESTGPFSLYNPHNCNCCCSGTPPCNSTFPGTSNCCVYVG